LENVDQRQVQFKAATEAEVGDVFWPRLPYRLCCGTRLMLMQLAAERIRIIMNGIISDFDGVIIETEQAKATSWYAAVMHILGQLPPASSAEIIARSERGTRLLEGIRDSMRNQNRAHLPESAEDWARLIGKKLPDAGPEEMAQLRQMSDMELALWCAGGPTAEFRDNMWDVFVANAPLLGHRQATEINEMKARFEHSRSTYKLPIMILGAQPISGNQRFFGKVLDTFGYPNASPLVLVNQSTSAGVKELFDLAHLWRAEPRLPNAFGAYGADSGFPRIVNVGDKRVVDKTEAYAWACGILGVQSEDTMTFEDTKAGVEAARKAGIGIVVGFRLTGSVQDLSKSDYIVTDSLEAISGVVKEFASQPVVKLKGILDRLRQHL